MVRSPLLTSHKWRELVPPGVWFADAILCRISLMLRLSGFVFVFVCFCAFTEAEALRSIVLRSSISTCMRPYSHTCFSLFFCCFGDITFSEYFGTIMTVFSYY